MIRVFSETDPGSGFESTETDLEDVYFYHVGASAADEKEVAP